MSEVVSGRARLRWLGLGYAHVGAGRRWLLLLGGLLAAWLASLPSPVPHLAPIAVACGLGLLFSEDGSRWKRWIFLYALVHYGIGVSWLAYVHPVQVGGASVPLTLVALACAGVLRVLVRRGVPLWLAAPTILVFEELARTVYLGGMPLPSLALPTAEAYGLYPAAALLGAYAFTFLAGSIGVWLYVLFARRPGWRTALLTAVPAVACLGLLVAYARVRLDDEAGLSSTGTDVMVVVQGNVPQALKHSPDPDAGNQMLQRHLGLMEQGMAAAGAAGERVVAVLWPETMVPWPFLGTDLAHRYPDDWENQVRVLHHVRASALTREEPPLVLLGAIFLFRRGEERHAYVAQYGNHDSLFLVDPLRLPDPEAPYPPPPPLGETPPWSLGRNDKHVLVPGGEYTPLGELLPPLRWFRNFVSVIPELEPGAEEQPLLTLLPADGARDAVVGGTAICFEVLFPARCRHLRRQGANILLNPSNYGWFGPSAFRAQIRAVGRLRAAETATTVVIAGNTGPTLFFDPRGRPYGVFEGADGGGGLDPMDDASTFRRGWARGPLWLDDEPTPYVRWGDLPWFALGTLVVSLAILRTLGSRDASVTLSPYENGRTEGEGENL